jgi:adenylate cyclase
MRRLAAILDADLVGYSGLMQRAQEDTEPSSSKVIEPRLSCHDGRLFKMTTGDSALAEFARPSAYKPISTIPNRIVR